MKIYILSDENGQRAYFRSLDGAEARREKWMADGYGWEIEAGKVSEEEIRNNCFSIKEVETEP